jgi:hypothetical protein
MKEIKFTYSRQRSGHEISEKLCEMKKLKSAIVSNELLLRKKITSSEKRKGLINTKLKDITNVSNQNISKAYPNSLLIKREEIPSICSSPYFPGFQIKRKADKSPIIPQREQLPDPAEPIQKNNGKPKCKKHTSKPQKKPMNISISKAVKKTDDMPVVIRPDDIAGKGFIWVKNTK